MKKVVEQAKCRENDFKVSCSFNTSKVYVFACDCFQFFLKKILSASLLRHARLVILSMDARY